MKFTDYDLWIEKLNQIYEDGIIFPLEPIGKHYFMINNRIDNVVAEWDIYSNIGTITGL